MSDYSDDDLDDDEYGGSTAWIYVEDHYEEADALVETTCPSPVEWVHHSQAEPDISDIFDYWNDLEYFSDGGWDDVDPRPSGRPLNTSMNESKATGPLNRTRTKKRKAESTPEHRTTKRRKEMKQGLKAKPRVATVQLRYPPVIWRTQASRRGTPVQSRNAYDSSTEAIAFMKDWRERFEDISIDNMFSKTSRSELEHVSDMDDDDGSREAITAAGFDLSDPQSVARLLSADQLDSLKKLLEDQGLDAAHIEAVLDDILSGKQRNFEDDHDEDTPDDDDEEGHGAT